MNALQSPKVRTNILLAVIAVLWAGTLYAAYRTGQYSMRLAVEDAYRAGVYEGIAYQKDRTPGRK